MRTVSLNHMAIVVAGLVSILSCSKDLIQETKLESDTTFRIYVPILQTKTSNEGLHTKWDGGERLNVHYAVSGTTDYVSAGRFDIKDATTGLAEQYSGSAPNLDANTSYDWYVFYRYNSNIAPDKSNSEVKIGCSYGDSQTQTGNDSMAHIYGANSTRNYFPLYGSVKNISGSEFPTIVMKNVASLLEYKVTNSLNKGIVVTGIILEGSDPLIGGVFLNYENEEVVVTSPGYSSNTATLNVAEGTSIMPGTFSHFYAGIIPRTQNSLTATVNVKDESGLTGSQVFTINPELPITFRPGKIKTLELNFNKEF